MKSNPRRKWACAAGIATRRAARPFTIERLESRTLLSAVSWINAYSGNWDTAANWSTGAVPDASSDVYIDQPGFIVITLQGPHAVANLSVKGDTLKISAGSLAISGAVTNAGTIQLEYGSQLNVTGSYTTAASAQLTLATSSGSSVTAGAISNSGKISLGAGDSISTASTFSQQANGDLAIELAGTASTQFGKLTVGGVASLSGKLEATLVNGYSPAVGDQMTALSYASEIGAFATFQLPTNSWFAFQPDFNPTSLQFTALSPAAPTTTVNVNAVLHPVNSNDVGVNLGWWDPQLITAQTKQLVQNAGLKLIRFPGGSSADDYHFNISNNYRSDATTIPQFAQFIEAVGATGMVTLDYGSASPQEGEAELAYLLGSPNDHTTIGSGIQWNDATGQWQTIDWHSVSYWASLRTSAPLAVDDGLNFMRVSHAAFTSIQYWEVGNELYGGWEIDHHGTSLPDGTATGNDHDPVTYVTFAATFAHFLAADQANFPPISIGIDSWDPAGVFDNNWTSRVLSNGKNLGFIPGFISDHSYMQSPFSESDDGLLNHSDTDPTSQYDWTTRFGNYENLLAQTLGSGAGGVQVLATEYNSDITNPGKQLTSLVNGLFLADSAGTLLDSGYSGGIVWDLRDYWNTIGNDSGSLYGWRQGGDYGLLGDPGFSNPPSTGAYIAYPSYFAEQLAAMLAQSGGQVVSAISSNGQFSSYAVMQANGHLTLLAVNKNPGAAVTEQFKIAGFTPGSQANIWQYGIAQDTAQSLTTDGASALAHFTAALTVAGGAFNYTLPAYSMTVIDLAPASVAAAPAIATVAAAAPNPATGSTAALSVLGAWAAGESNLIYTWTATALPIGASPPTFSENQSNHAKNITATFYAAGNYTFTATIRTPGGASVTSSVNLTVNQTLAQILVVKPSPNLAPAATETLSATALDQFGLPMNIQSAFTWSVAPGGAGGSINAAGTYTAPASGFASDTLVATSGVIHGSTTLNIIGAGPVNVIDFANGFANAGASLILNSVAAIRGSKLALIDDGYFQASSAYAATPVNVAAFTTQFGFHLNNAWPMAHGFTFIIQTAGPVALGGDGDGLGYAGIAHSVAIKFDMYQTSSGNGSTGVYTNGADPSAGSIELGQQQGFSLRSWDPSQATITYDGVTLNVVLTDLYTGATDTKSYTVNIPAIIGGNTAWVGFTAASGALTTAQSITGWTYTNAIHIIPPPAAPTGLTPISGNGQVNLSWNASATATSYNLAQSTSLTGPYTNIAIGITATHFNVSSLTNSQTYYFQVTAINAGGASAPSSAASATPQVPPALPTPTGFTATAGNASVTLAWNAIADATSYTIQYGIASGNYSRTLANITGTTATVTLLSNATPYYFIVVAVNSAGSSGNSTEVSATPSNAPPVVIRIVDDNDTGFTKTGNWGSTFEPGRYFNGDHSFAKSGNGADVATYTFTGLIPGVYRVAATWYGDTNRATATPFTISDNVTLVGSVTVNQQLQPASFTDQGSAWGTLGAFAISSGTLVVTIRDTADVDLYVDADAVRIERIGDIIAAPVLQVADGSTSLASGATDNFGTTAPGTPITHTFTITNAGTTPLTLGSITLPTGFTLAANFGSAALQPAASTTFQIRMDAAANGNFSGILSFLTNDPAVPTFSLTLSGTAATAPPAPVIQIIDDNDTGFAETGAWGSSFEPGRYFGNDHSFAKSGNGADFATYTFTGITPGIYRVSATWRGDTNRATATPFTISDGSTTVGNVTINQQQQPASFTDQGANWGDLGTFSITGTTLVVTIRDTADASLYVDADAIRIERTGDLGFVPPPPNPVFIVDDQSANWTAVGNWGSTVEPGRYYGDGHSFAINGHGADVATWTFTGLSPGKYRVSATWRGDTNRATDAPFTLLDGATPLTTVIVNQQNSPAGFSDQGVSWSDLGAPVTITGDTLIVRLTDNADLYVDADAIRIERIGD